MNEQRTVFMRGLRIIGSYIRTHPGPFAIAVTGATVYAAMTVGSTIVLGRITDRVLVPAFRGGVAAGALWWGVAAVLLVAVIRAAGIITRRYFASMTTFRTQVTLRTRVVDQYQALPLAYHRSHPTGELLAHAEADVIAATDVLGPLPYSIAVILLMVFAIVALLATDLFLALIGLAILPGLAFLNRYYSKRVEEPAKRAQERMGDVSAVAHESIDGALVVKTLGREAEEVARLAEQAARLRDERIRMGRQRAVFEPAIEAMPNIGIVILIGVGAWRYSTGSITLGTLVQFVSLFQILALPMHLIGHTLSEIPRAVAGNERLKEVFAEPVALPPSSGGGNLPPGPLGVSLRDVSFSYGPSPVLEGVSFEVAPNEAVALVGPTGSGKSTLTQLLVRLADPDRGSVRLGGVDLHAVSQQGLREAVTIVFQESFLFATTVVENITLGAEVSEGEVRRAAAVAQADEFVRALPHGYGTVLGERGVTLSGGQRQRIALARALARRPRLLILDDATSAVDPTVEAAILEGLRHHLETTLVVVAYRVSTIALADRVLYLDQGRIAAAGTHLELLAHADYAAMVRAYERGTVGAGRDGGAA